MSAELEKFLDDSGVWKKDSVVDSGSTADGLRIELQSGLPATLAGNKETDKFDDSWHGLAAISRINRLDQWLAERPNAPAGDRRAILELIIDLGNSVLFMFPQTTERT